MGAGMAATYALCGYPVSLYSRTEPTLVRAQETVGAALRTLVQEGMAEQAAADAAAERIACTTSLPAAADGAWYIAETIVENADAKRALFAALDDFLPENVILASNSSYLDISPLLPGRRKAHGVMAHWVSPPQIIPLVEVIRGEETSEETMQKTIALHEACGKTVVRLEKYVPGFVLNRLQGAITREVMYLIDGGYCSPQDIDKVVKTSLMPRGLLLGVVERMDFAGLDLAAHALENGTYQPAPPVGKDGRLFSLVKDGNYGVKSGKGFYDYSGKPRTEVLAERDRRLIQSLRLSQLFMQEPLHRRDEDK